MGADLRSVILQVTEEITTKEVEEEEDSTLVRREELKPLLVEVKAEYVLPYSFKFFHTCSNFFGLRIGDFGNIY
jgi:hypothetical protein